MHSIRKVEAPCCLVARPVPGLPHPCHHVGPLATVLRKGENHGSLENFLENESILAEVGNHEWSRMTPWWPGGLARRQEPTWLNDSMGRHGVTDEDWESTHDAALRINVTTTRDVPDEIELEALIVEYGDLGLHWWLCGAWLCPEVWRHLWLCRFQGEESTRWGRGLSAEGTSDLSWLRALQHGAFAVEMSVWVICGAAVIMAFAEEMCQVGVPSKSVLQQCQVRVSCERVQQERPGVSSKRVWDKCQVRVSLNNVRQGSPARVSSESVLQKWQVRVSHKCVT